MDIREQIKTYTTHGGAWNHLSKRLIDIGLIEEFTVEFIDYSNSQLSAKHSKSVLQVFDAWAKNRSEREAKLTMLLVKQGRE